MKKTVFVSTLASDMLAKVTDSDPYMDLDLTPSDIKQYVPVLDYLQLATMFEGGV
jgi:hypothetical protein